MQVRNYTTVHHYLPIGISDDICTSVLPLKRRVIILGAPPLPKHSLSATRSSYLDDLRTRL